MNKIDKFLDLIYIETKYSFIQTRKRREQMKDLILFLRLKDTEKLDKIIDKLLFLYKNNGGLLVGNSLNKILIKEYPKEIQEYALNLKMQEFQNLRESDDSLILNKEVNCSACGNLFFSKRKNYHYICNHCLNSLSSSNKSLYII